MFEIITIKVIIIIYYDYNLLRRLIKFIQKCLKYYSAADFIKNHSNELIEKKLDLFIEVI